MNTVELNSSEWAANALMPFLTPVQNITANKLGLDEPFIRYCLSCYDRPHRFYHNIWHVYKLISLFKGLERARKLTRREAEILNLTALFHDLSYCPDPLQSNEFNSIAIFDDHVKSCKDSEIIKGLIYATACLDKDCDKYRNGKLYDVFSSADLEYPMYGDTNTISKNELKMLKEFQLFDYKAYRAGRTEFLKKFGEKYGSTQNLLDITEYLKNYRPRIGVYPGSFRPFHIGHLNVLEQAEKIFDKVIIALGKNPDKEDLTSVDAIKEILPYHQVEQYNGLLSDYIKTVEEYADVTVIRGLRNSYDLLHEENNLRILEDCGCKTPVIYFMCGKEFQHVSSSMVRGLQKVAPNKKFDQYLVKKYYYTP